MAARKYLHRRKSVFSGCGTVLTVAALALVFLVVIAWLLFDNGRDVAADAGPMGPISAQPPAETSGGGTVASGRDASGSFFALSTSEARDLWLSIRESAYVASNPKFEAIIRNTAFIYADSDDGVNAYASYRRREQVRCPTVALLCGMTRFATVAAFAFAAAEAGVVPDAVAKLSSAMTPDDIGEMPERRASELFALAGLTVVTNHPQWRSVRSRAVQVRAGHLVGILAHEAGHLAHGHPLTDGLSNDNEEVSRNEEREADSFCNSIVSTSPNGAHIMEGMLLYRCLSIRQERAAKARESTHPLSEERLRNLVRAAPGVARTLGLTGPDSVLSGAAGPSKP